MAELPFRCIKDIDFSDISMDDLKRNINYNQDYFVSRTDPNKLIREKRLTALLSTIPEIEICYSGKIMKSQPLTEPIKKIKELVELITDVKYDTILCNWYQRGEDCMGWHRDEVGVSKGKHITIVSFGETRIFSVRDSVSLWGENLPRQWNFELKHGDVFYMYGNCQELYDHCIRKGKNERISLTFRQMNNC